MRITTRLVALAAIALVATVAQVGTAQAEFGVAPGNFVVSLSGGSPAGPTQAGGHPDLITSFDVNRKDPSDPNEFAVPDGTIKDLDLELPEGLVADPTALATCDMGRVTNYFAKECPRDAAAGVVEYVAANPVIPTSSYTGTTRLWRVTTQPGEAAAFGFAAQLFVVRLAAIATPSGGYRVHTYVRSMIEAQPVIKTTVTLWGVPALHQGELAAGEPGAIWDTLAQAWFGGPLDPLPAVTRPFVSAPGRCDAPLQASLQLTSWQTGEPTAPVYSELPPMTGCDRLGFEPTVSVVPTDTHAGQPSGYAVDIDVPQTDDSSKLSTADVKDVSVTLPAGTAISPPAADGLDSCSDAELAIDADGEETCPEASRIGSVTIDTPLLEEPLEGSVYVGEQLSADPESGKMFRLFLTAEASGVKIKLAGAIKADASSGQLTAVFANNPQMPFEHLHLELNGGPRAPLTNPPRCGTYVAKAQITPWSGTGTVTREPTFTVDQGCPTGSFAPTFEAGTVNSTAGSFSPFVLRVTRGDGETDLSKLAATLPQGLLAKLAGVPLCGEAQAASGGCPTSSRVGTVTVGAGSGPLPLYVPQPAKESSAVYLAGAYNGAPYSLVVKVPAQAGPFNLGTVTVRNALHIDPNSTQVTATSDPLPQIVGGIPISYRDIRIDIDRPEFTVNPTSCEPMQVSGTIGSSAGTSANVSDRYQSADCQALGFAPKLALRLSGAPPRRGANPALRATLTPQTGNANIGKVTVVLPATELLEQGHIRTVCTRVQFAANECPAGSIYGHAKAWTPLLDEPLEGPVYLRSNGGERKLPDLVADLNGSIRVVLVGYIDSVKRHGSPRIRTRFLEVPDASVSRFVLEMQGGKKSLLANNTNLCKTKPRAEVALTGQNAANHENQPVVNVGGCGGKKSKARKQSRAHQTAKKK